MMLKKTVLFVVAPLLLHVQASMAAEHPSESVFRLQQQSASQLALQAERLSSEMRAHCVQSDDLPDLAGLQQQWHKVMQAWMALQGQERGPVAALDKSWSIQFWPDKKNTTGRKMAALLQQEGAVTTQQIADASVTVQGLGALEWLLFDGLSPAGKSQQAFCRLARPIADNLSHNTQVIQSAWENNPWRQLEEKQWQREYLALLSNQLDYTLKKLTRPMAKLGKPKPYFAESWRAGLSLANLQFNLNALKKLYFAGDKGLDALLRKHGHSDLAHSLSRQFATMQETWPQQQSLFVLLQDKQGYRQALALRNKFEQLQYLLTEQAAIALGIVVGFNATDGD